MSRFCRKYENIVRFLRILSRIRYFNFLIEILKNTLRFSSEFYKNVCTIAPRIALDWVLRFLIKILVIGSPNKMIGVVFKLNDVNAQVPFFKIFNTFLIAYTVNTYFKKEHYLSKPSSGLNGIP
jgi:hypothetical protein